VGEGQGEIRLYMGQYGEDGGILGPHKWINIQLKVGQLATKRIWRENEVGEAE
jgi:hypothetical protein